MEQMFSLTSIFENFIDLAIIFLQTFSFFIKVSDADTFNINPEEILYEDVRFKHQVTHFLARNFRDFCIMETIGLIFILLKVVDGLRYNEKVNKIILTVLDSTGSMVIFLTFWILINIALTPLAQAIWANHLLGYKTFSDGMLSVFMI